MGLHAVLLMRTCSGSDILICSTDTEQKTDPAFALHLTLTGLAYREIRPSFPVYLVLCII